MKAEDKKYKIICQKCAVHIKDCKRILPDFMDACTDFKPMDNERKSI